MKKLKGFILAILAVIIGVALIFIIELFLNGSQIKLLIKIGSLIMILFSIFVIFQLTSKKSKRLGLFKSRFYSLLIIIVILVSFSGGFYISVYNIALHSAFGNELTVSEKIEQFKSLRSSIKLKKDYDLTVNAYIKDLNKVEVDHVTIYFDEEIDKDCIETIKNSVPLAEDLNSNIYGDLKKLPLKIIFYSDMDKFKVHGFESDTVQGFFDGENIHMKAFSKADTQTYVEEIFIHEYSHYAYERYASENNIISPLPSWFNEGLAEYISMHKDNRQAHLDFISNPEDLRNLQSMEDLLESFGPSETNENFFNPYYYSYFVVKSIVDLKGEQAIRDIILSTKERDFYQAFENIVGVDIETYQRENFVDYMKNQVKQY